MISRDSITITPIGYVASALADPHEAPRQGDEGAPQARIGIDPRFAAAMADLRVGDRIIVITWLHLADPAVLTVHPRDDPQRPLTGVFSTRSADRPNPIGLHEVEILEIGTTHVVVSDLEAIDGSPVLDIKPVLGPGAAR